MFDLFELFTKKSLYLIILASLVAGFSYYFDLDIINIRNLDKVKINDKPLEKPQIAYILFGAAVLATGLTAVFRIRELRTGLLSASSLRLSGVYESDLHYNEELIKRFLARYGVPKGWSREQFAEPGTTECARLMHEAMSKLDEIIGFPFYAAFSDLETELKLMLMVQPHSNK